MLLKLMARIERASNQKPLDMRYAGNKQKKGILGSLAGGFVGGLLGGLPGAMAGAFSGDAIEEYAKTGKKPDYDAMYGLTREMFTRVVNENKPNMHGFF